MTRRVLLKQDRFHISELLGSYLARQALSPRSDEVK